MTKQGGSYKSWKKRWFILKGSQLFYFKTKKVLFRLPRHHGLCRARLDGFALLPLSLPPPLDPTGPLRSSSRPVILI